MALSDIQTLVDAKVRDTGDRIAPEQRDAAIAAALARYSADRPRTVVADLVADGTNILALPAGWDEDSEVIQLESPPEQVPAAVIRRWHMLQRPDELVIMIADKPASGATVRVTHTAAHQLSAVADTVPLRDRDAVACWAAAELLDQLASAFAGDRDTILQTADNVSQSTRSKDFARQAETFRKRYADHLAATAEEAGAAGPASATVVLPSVNSHGRPRFWRR